MPSLVEPNKGKIGSNVARQGCMIGLATVGHHSHQFTRDLILMDKPLNFFYTYSWVAGRSIPEAYNILFDMAKKAGDEFLFLKEEDTIAPGHSLVSMYRKLKYNPDIFAITGVYPRRDASDPSPFFYRGNGRGSYYDWKWGEFFEVTGVPFGCLLLRVADLDKMDDLVNDIVIDNYPSTGLSLTVKEYCKTDAWVTPEDGSAIKMISQDLYFSGVARDVGLHLFVDASVNCEHLDLASGKKFIVPHYLHDPAFEVDDSGKTAINLGCGQEWGAIHRIKPVRVDYREEVEPDLRMDLRDLSGISDSSYDYVYSSHTLEHFPVHESKTILSEMVRICKSGGEVHLKLPNVIKALQYLESGNNQDALWWHLYGRHEGDWDVHHSGFSSTKVAKWLTEMGLKGVIYEHELNLLVRAFKPPLPEWLDEFKVAFEENRKEWTEDRFFNYDLDGPPEPRTIKVGPRYLPIADDVPDENIEAYFSERKEDETDSK